MRLLPKWKEQRGCPLGGRSDEGSAVARKERRRWFCVLGKEQWVYDEKLS